jgi:hypothetical protein
MPRYGLQTMLHFGNNYKNTIFEFVVPYGFFMRSQGREATCLPGSREAAKLSASQVANKLVASFKKAFDISPEPPACFYLAGQPLADEPYEISMPELGTICLLNGVALKFDRQYGCLTQIEDLHGLLATIRAAGQGRDSSKGLETSTNWRLLEWHEHAAY